MKTRDRIEKARIFNRNDYLLGIVIILTSFLFYFKTLAPTILWGDPAKLVLNAYPSHFRIYQSELE
jgi:hypothetical protein